jgi:peptidoglycan/xylan/chitin deacetylase (PgdA/CDA1 family)
VTSGARQGVRRQLGAVRGHARRARRAAGPLVRNGAVCLLYHRVAHEAVDPWRLAVEPLHLAEHLQILADYTSPLTASALHSAREGGRIPPRTTVLTFDDGYGDLAMEVAPRLERSGVPATMFVVSSAVGRDREFWWDSLARALLGPDAGRGMLTLSIGGNSSSWNVDDRVSSSVVHKDVWAKLRGRPPEERDALAEHILAWAGLPLQARPGHRTLTLEELQRLADHDLVQVGAHTANHAWLAGLDPAAQRREVEQGIIELQGAVAGPITSFAYPHGGWRDVGPAALAAVRSTGVDTAFLATPGRLRAGGDPHRLPRVFVEDMDGDGFAALLWQFAGIKVG